MNRMNEASFGVDLTENVMDPKKVVATSSSSIHRRQGFFVYHWTSSAVTDGEGRKMDGLVHIAGEPKDIQKKSLFKVKG